MGFLDTIRTQARALTYRPQAPLYKANFGDSLPAWLQATGEAHKFDQLNTPESQARLYTQLSWIQTAVGMVAATAITSKLKVKRQQNVDATEQDVDNHPFEQLLQRPNPAMSRSEFIESTISFHRISGNAYWWKNCKDEKSPPDELWIIPPQQLRPLPDGKMFVRGYLYDPGDGKEIFLEPWEVVHFKRFNAINMFVGMSALEALSLVSQGDLSAQRWNLNFFDKDNAKLPGALAFSDPVDDDAWTKIKSDVEYNYGGTKRKLMMLRNVGKGGVQWLNMAVSQKDMEFLAGREFNRDEIYAALAPGLASILDKNATEANAVAGKSTFIEYAVWPYLVHIAEKITNDLLPIYGDGLVSEFEDIRITDRNLKIAEQNAFAAVHTIDEVRAKFYNDKPLGDERGKLLVVEVPVLARQPVADAAVLDIPQTPTVDIAKPAALLTDGTQKPQDATRPQDAAQQAQPAKAIVEDDEDLADEVKRFKNWLRKRKNPAIDKFSSDLLTAERKAQILESMTVDAVKAETVKPRGANATRPAIPTTLDITDEDIDRAIAQWDNTMPQFAGIGDAEVA